MTGIWKAISMTVLLAAVCCKSGFGQVAPATILEIDVENLVNYGEDTSDLSKFATDPNVTTPSPPRNFSFALLIGDIVAVNGQPAKGTLTRNLRQVSLGLAGNPGQAIADTQRAAVLVDAFEILKSDGTPGTPIGIIVTSGFGTGSPPRGAPLSITQGNYAITGGTGAFLGARGQAGQAASPQPPFPRQASVMEDPANRRRNGGGRLRFVLQVIPMFRPEIAQTLVGPAVTHSSDFSLVSASKPAAAGEILSAFVTGLGPTRPGVDPGKPFPTSSLAAVNSPVEVTVNGRPAEVLAAVGFPGAVDGYQVNFRVPPDTARGTATIQVSAAWIAGSEVKIVIQ
ncbi:MAG: hypothetical protein HY238_17365 [Acidobacteria bacterium]|nr:hypothetical protein [Acidobacteriota bacterium]